MNPCYPALLGLGLTVNLIAQADNRPNVLYVFPDQMRNHAMQFWNQQPYSEHVRFKADPVFTPNLNRFADESVVLTSAQSGCPLSSPHRGMLLTGMYPDGSGVTLNCNSMRPASSLREDVVAISDVFSRNGYRCAYIGKLHVDFPTPNNPQHPDSYVETQSPVWDAYTPKERRHGFDYWYSYGTFDVHKSPHYWDTEGNRHDISEWSPKHEADKAIEYLESVSGTGKPFFMMLAMNPPHSPYQSLNDVMEEDYNRYKDTPLNELLLRPNINPALTERIKCAPYYFAAITGVDREFGRILAALEKLGLAENTIVVFSSDHGDTMGSHVEDPKNSPYAEAMNVPFIVRYPKKLKPRVSDVLLATPDIMPTLLSMAGLKTKIPVEVQGRDLSAFFTGKKAAKEAPQAVLYLRNVPGEKNEMGEIIDYFPAARGVKTQDYTMAITLDKQKRLKEVLLFDDRNDPYQLNNLPYKEHPALFKMLCKKMATLLKNAGDPWQREKILSEIIPY